MPAARIALPDDPEQRRFHLLGLNAATQGLDQADVEARRPALEPYRSAFDQGYAVGCAISDANPARRKALQAGTGGLRHRVETIEEQKKARKLPELP